MDKSVVPHVYSLLLGRGDAAENKQKLDKGLLEWTGAFVGDGPFFSGAQPSMPDIMLAPFAVRLTSPALKAMLNGYELPPATDTPSKRLAAWCSAIAAHEAVQATMSDEGEVLRMYESYAASRK